ncbi:MAG: hypothetical protein EA378_09740 [Phycisphaerales bacterium]|nr:MAG: hypothetical protein EA378_09740 [Phycisphaerales bacterium]
MSRDRVIQLVALLMALLFAGVSTVLGMQLTASAGKHRLTYADRAEEGDPPQVALGIAMGAFRGIFVNMLWMRANDLKEAGRYHEAINLSRAITTLQPRFPRVWAFHAWNMAYNISVTTNTREERWQWVNKGIRLLREEAIPANPNDMLLHRELAWTFLHKVSGITDDANQYYKRALAAEWHWLLGRPPTNAIGLSGRDATIEAYAAWLGEIADAPRTLAGAYELERRLIREGMEEGTIPRDTRPALPRLVDELAAIDLRPNYTLLERVGMNREVERSARREAYRAVFGARTLRLQALLDDPQYESAWPILLAHTRRHVLVNEYRMDPYRMIRYTRRFGPIDWRHPAAHAVYWSARGSEESEETVTGTSAADVDIVNSERILLQGVQELYRFGELLFDPLDFLHRGELGSYLAMPNIHFLDTYGRIMTEMRDRAGIFESRTRAFTTYSAGYENFLQDAIRFLYRRGQREQAERYYSSLRTFAEQNLNDPMTAEWRTLPLDEFIQYQFREERFRTTYVASSEIVAALQAAFLVGLLNGNDEVFRSNMDYAREFHRRYMETSRRLVTASGAVGRAEVIPADFDLLLGTTFAQAMRAVSLEDAETMYTNAPMSLRRYGFDLVSAMYQNELDALAAANQSEPFAVLFPEPPNMDRFRRELEERLTRRQRELDLVPQ